MRSGTSLLRRVSWSLRMGDCLSDRTADPLDGDGLRRHTVTSAGTTKFIWDGQDVLL